MTKRFTSLTIESPDDLIFGHAPYPVQITPEIVAGGGETLPELNYTLPHGAEVSAARLDQVRNTYRQMAAGALQRAVELEIPRCVIEIELVFEMTLNPAWGEAIIRDTREVIEEYKAQGVHTALRATIADIRDRTRPPRNRSSEETALVLESFERCAPHADILSIESTGGKEVSDEALLMCDIGGATFALGRLGSNDMEFLWSRIVEIAKKHGKVAGGDAACGFANTAMQLARQRMVPKVLAAVVRAAGAARSLVAVECGARGPDKDCAYEGPVLKAIAGIPIAMEGKSAACAHSSHIGNVAMCCCDLWSNESTPYAQLFGGFTPAVSLEELWYDCKLMNEALRTGHAQVLQRLLADSDARDSAEALVLTPESAIRIARAIVSSTDYAERAANAAREAVAIIEEAVQAGALTIAPREAPFLDKFKADLDHFAALGDGMTDYYAAMYPGKFIPEEYGL